MLQPSAPNVFHAGIIHTCQVRAKGRGSGSCALSTAWDCGSCCSLFFLHLEQTVPLDRGRGICPVPRKHVVPKAVISNMTLQTEKP